MKSFLLAVLGLLCFTSTSFAVAPIISTFDVNNESWTADGAAIVYEGSGGNPGGFLKITDNRGDTYSIFAPAKFRGDLSAFDGGLLSYDILQLEPTTPLGSVGSGFGRIGILGGGLNATFDYAPDPPIPSTLTWKSYIAPLNAAAWHTSQEDWEQILSNVLDVNIILDLKPGEDTIGFDNFKVQPVPEPTTLSLLGLSFLGLIKRKKIVNNQNKK